MEASIERLPAEGVLSSILRQIAPALPAARAARVVVVGCGVRIHFPWAKTERTFRTAVERVRDIAREHAGAEIVAADEPFEDPRKLLAFLSQQLASGIDGIILVHASYTAGEIGAQMGRWLIDHCVPVLSWSQPEALPGPTAGNQANSLCCQNFLLQMWRRLGVRYAWMHHAIDRSADEPIARFLRVAQAVARLKHGAVLHAGGSRVTAFYDGEADELAVMRRFGLQYDRMDLEAVFDVARKVPQRDLDRLRTALFEDARCRTVDVPVEQADQTLRLGLAIQRLAAERGYIGVTIKSWPELFDCYGCAADGAVSMLNDAGLCTAEEGEMPGLLSSLVMHALSAGSAVPTMMDVSVLDEPANEIGLWHCGACPTRWLARGAWYQATRHSILENADRESAVGMMLEFPLTGGPGTVVRYQSPDCGRCFAFEATLRPVDPMPMRGNYVAARPMHRTAGAILSTIMSRGLDHHWSLGFGHLGADVSLFNHFLEVEDIEVVPAGVSPQKSVGE